MDVYFDKAIPQMVARARHALDSVPSRLSSELTVLAQKCVTELNSVLIKLDRLATDSRLCEPQNREERLREFQRVVRDLDYIQNVGLAAIERVSDHDQRLNHLVQHIREEISYPLPLPPAVTTISRDYFYVHTRFNFNLVCVPPGEKGSLLHLPDLYHELAHPLLRERNISRVQPFKQALTKVRDLVLSHFYVELQEQERQRGPDVFKFYLERWMQSWFRFWSVEFLCDLFAIYTVGPAFAWAHLHLCAKRTNDPFEFRETPRDSHPADDARMQLMLFALDRIGFTDEANLIDARWQELLITLSTNKEPEYRRCYPRDLIAAVENLAFQGVAAMNCSFAGPGAPGYVRGMLNKAWYEFWQERPSYGDWDKEQTELLYQYCDTTPVGGAVKVGFQSEDKESLVTPIRKTDLAERRRPQSPTEAEVTFENPTAELITDISTNINHLSPPFTILFVAGDRGGGQRNQIQIPREFDSVKEAIRGCDHREAFNLANPILAATHQKLVAAYRDRPAILHFAGHGDDRSLSFISDQGLLVSHTPVIAEQLATILSNFPDRVHLCVLNTCDSATVAQHIVNARVVDAAIGWPAKLSDTVAIAFSRVLYGSLGDGLTLSQSVTLATQSCGSDEKPHLHTNMDVNPNAFTFVKRGKH